MSEKPYTPIAWEVARKLGADPTRVHNPTGGYPDAEMILARKVAELEVEVAQLRERLEWYGRKSLMDKGMEP